MIIWSVKCKELCSKEQFLCIFCLILKKAGSFEKNKYTYHLNEKFEKICWRDDILEKTATPKKTLTLLILLKTDFNSIFKFVG